MLKRPVIRINDINPMLFSFVEELNEVKVSYLGHVEIDCSNEVEVRYLGHMAYLSSLWCW